jgi:hypothetical protein
VGWVRGLGWCWCCCWCSGAGCRWFAVCIKCGGCIVTVLRTCVMPALPMQPFSHTRWCQPKIPRVFVLAPPWVRPRQVFYTCAVLTYQRSPSAPFPALLPGCNAWQHVHTPSEDSDRGRAPASGPPHPVRPWAAAAHQCTCNAELSQHRAPRQPHAAARWQPHVGQQVGLRARWNCGYLWRAITMC